MGSARTGRRGTQSLFRFLEGKKGLGQKGLWLLYRETWMCGG